MDFNFDIKKLEKIFSNNFNSLSYAILGSEYIKQNDIDRALTVLQIGQENNPDDLVGKYLLAKTFLLKNQIKKSKELLNEILDSFPLNLKARLLIIEILKKEKQNHKDLPGHIELLQEYFPNHGGPKKAVISDEVFDQEPEKPKAVRADKNQKESDSHFSINENMATFTLVNILITQKNLKEALIVLDILEKKGKNLKKIKEKRNLINKKLKKQ